METLDKIAEKSAELFLQYGVTSVTMDDIATHLGMAKKTIYKFFENKNALVENFIVKETAGNINRCSLLVNTNSDPIIELFFTIIYARALYFKINPAIIRALKKDHHYAYLILSQHKKEFIFNSIKHSIEKGIRLFLYQDDFNVEAMSGFFLESLAVFSGNENLKVLETANHEDILGHMICGIATPAGLEKINCYKSQHKFTLYAQTLEQPFWED